MVTIVSGGRVLTLCGMVSPGSSPRGSEHGHRERCGFAECRQSTRADAASLGEGAGLAWHSRLARWPPLLPVGLRGLQQRVRRRLLSRLLEQQLAWRVHRSLPGVTVLSRALVPELPLLRRLTELLAASLPLVWWLLSCRALPEFVLPRSFGPAPPTDALGQRRRRWRRWRLG
jgi:hypothetical protein